MNNLNEHFESLRTLMELRESIRARQARIHAFYLAADKCKSSIDRSSISNLALSELESGEVEISALIRKDLIAWSSITEDYSDG